MTEMTQEEALLQAEALVRKALKETEARCAVLGQFINDCDRQRAQTPGLSGAVRELGALHSRRRGLLRRHGLIQQALDCAVGERPASVLLSPPPSQAARQTQQQVQLVRARRHR